MGKGLYAALAETRACIEACHAIQCHVCMQEAIQCTPQQEDNKPELSMMHRRLQEVQYQTCNYHKAQYDHQQIVNELLRRIHHRTMF